MCGYRSKSLLCTWRYVLCIEFILLFCFYYYYWNVLFQIFLGIPKDKLDLREIDSLPTIIENPEDGPLSAWEILWSDPLPQERFAELAHFTNIDITNCQGYLFNKKRGTAWFFNEDALDRFLSINELSHIVRAHEVPNNGFFFHFSKKCATIFSCSHYCGNNNECAVLFIERDVIRVVRIDTVNNKPATD